MKLILASNNKNKLREFREILEPMGFEVMSQSEAGADIEAEENGSTFAENAYIKAKVIYDIFRIPVISDDSGLAVDALNGAPGIYSARYAEDGKHCQKLLSEMKDVPDEKRTARFICSICYIDEEGEKHICEGKCEGKIGYEELGTNGFGYDPVFMYGDKSFAEISAEEKNAVSHRSMALKEFEKFIRTK
ncbi:MAG: RdgB/HAM1 family non-canonical purine NTP pyrophosphatase [Huintestinicola sp.]